MKSFTHFRKNSKVDVFESWSSRYEGSSSTRWIPAVVNSLNIGYLLGVFVDLEKNCSSQSYHDWIPIQDTHSFREAYITGSLKSIYWCRDNCIAVDLPITFGRPFSPMITYRSYCCQKDAKYESSELHFSFIESLLKKRLFTSIIYSWHCSYLLAFVYQLPKLFIDQWS